MEKNKAREEQGLPPPWCPTPYLVYQDADEKKQIFCNSFLSKKSESIEKSIPQLCGRKIAGCCHGWLVLNDLKSQSQWWLWDPVSLELIELPRLKLQHVGTISCVLTAPPHGEVECLVLMFEGNRAMFCKPEGKQWTEQVIEFEPWNHAIVNGVIFSLEKEFWRIFEIQVNAEAKSISTIYWLENLGRPIYRRSIHTDHYFLESLGQLVWVMINSVRSDELEVLAIERVAVWRMDMEQWGWTEAKNLDGHAFFLGSSYSMSCANPGSGGAEKNCIYFTFLNDVTVYCYGMEDNSLTVLLPCKRKLLANWCGPYWILLSHRSAQQYESQEEEKLSLMAENTALQDRAREVPEAAVDNAPLECGTLGTDFERLPDHVIVSLTRQLKITDYLSFRRVCKKFHTGAPLPMTKKLENYTASSPWLMFLNNDQSTWKLVDPINNSFHFINNLPHLKDGEIVFSSRNGTLIMHRSKYLLYYYNPFSTVSGELPFPNKEAEPLETMAFSSFPSSSDSVTIGAINRFHQTDIYCFQTADQKWRRYSFEYIPDIYPAYGSPIYFNKAFYFLDEFGSIDTLELQVDDELWRNSLGCSPTNSGSFYASYLVECDNKLFIVGLGHLGEKVQVFRVDFSGTGIKNVEVNSLGRRTFFVSRRSTFGVVAPIPKMANRIYFPWFRGEGLIYYSLKTTKFHAVGSNESFDNFYFSKKMLNAAWVLPSW